MEVFIVKKVVHYKRLKSLWNSKTERAEEC